MLLDDGGSPVFGGAHRKAPTGTPTRNRLSPEMRARLDQIVATNDDPAVRQWARALVESVGGDAPDAETREWAAGLLEQLAPASATKRATGPEQNRGVRSYLEYLSRNDPNPTVRLRAEAVLDRGRRPA